MTYGIFRLIISYVLANNPTVKNSLHVRDLETLMRVCASEDIEAVIDINHVFNAYKKATRLQVSTDTLYTYFRSLGVRFTGEYF